jgi:murein DD-endopeptidase MepM/ murein hydrolase activator NlpD
MSIAEYIGKNKVSSFLVGMLGVQACALLAAFALRGGQMDLATPSSPAEVSSTAVPPSDTLGTEPLGALEAPPRNDGAVTLPTTGTSYTVKRGDSFSSIWTEHGAARSGGVLALNALNKADPKAGTLREGAILELTISASGDIVGLKHRFSDAKVVELTGDSTNGYTATVSPLVATETPRTVSGMITESLALAAQQLDVPYAVVDDLVDIFGSRVAFERSIQWGDTFSISFTERRDASGTLLPPGPITAASIGTGDKILAAIGYAGADGKFRYYAENGAALGNEFLRYPLKFTRISSVFTTARFHPVLQKKRAHNGVDFAAPTGTPVRSVADGVVVFAGWTTGGGHTLRIKHCGRYTTEYMHLSKFAKGLKVGTAVSRSEAIGAVGATGMATGPHLHFALYDKGKYVNPLKADLPTTSNVPPLPEGYLTAALDTIHSFHHQVRLAQAELLAKRPA